MYVYYCNYTHYTTTAKIYSICITYATIVGNMSELVKRNLSQGDFFEKDFEDCSVLIDRSGIMKDHLVVN